MLGQCDSLQILYIIVAIYFYRSGKAGYVNSCYFKKGKKLSGKAFECRSRGPRFEPGCPLLFLSQLQ